MRLRPRQYILVALILALGLFNFVRSRRARTIPASLPVQASIPATLPRPNSPAWDAFDHAAALRDAPATDFAPALNAFREQTAKASDPDLSGCSTWLEFYRQGVVHPSHDASWRNPSAAHLDTCVKLHRDVSS